MTTPDCPTGAPGVGWKEYVDTLTESQRRALELADRINLERFEKHNGLLEMMREQAREYPRRTEIDELRLRLDEMRSRLEEATRRVWWLLGAAAAAGGGAGIAASKLLN